eukprot:871921-Pyramimonas_sp.AAC.1
MDRSSWWQGICSEPLIVTQWISGGPPTRGSPHLAHADARVASSVASAMVAWEPKCNLNGDQPDFGRPARAWVTRSRSHANAET